MSIRVLLVEDSLVALTILKRILDQAPQIEVVGTARTGLEAIALIPETHPDVICTDLHMPQMNGLELTYEVMSLYPRPILVVSASVQEDDVHHIFRLLEAGAVDVFPKPAAGLMAGDRMFSQTLINKIQVLSGVKVFKKKRLSLSCIEKTSIEKTSIEKTSIEKRNIERSRIQTPSATVPRPQFKIVAIGASTGGPLALQALFSVLPGDFPLPIVCVQHISRGFLQGLIEWLSLTCALPIQIAQPGEQPRSGTIYFPVEQRHLELDSKGKFVCTGSSLVDGHCPSVTTTFESVAGIYGKKAIGILLTGMGRDGASGLQTIHQAGGMTIAQDEATSVVFGMPQEAIKLGAARRVLPIQAIAPALLKLLKEQSVIVQ